uniref:Wsv414-like protein n=1 Tax=Sicyonia whispovirus TaxID=2984283 RepID=A0A9C7BNN6_9VIRU|nr:MAG: wsv414-like protein [Sicyonia whispovirus]
MAPLEGVKGVKQTMHLGSWYLPMPVSLKRLLGNAAGALTPLSESSTRSRSRSLTAGYLSKKREMTTALPFNRPSAQVNLAGPALEDVSGSLTTARIGISLLMVLSFAIIVVAIVNIRKGTGMMEKYAISDSGTPSNLSDDVVDVKHLMAYPNKMRDYIILTASLLAGVTAVASLCLSKKAAA